MELFDSPPQPRNIAVAASFIQEEDTTFAEFISSFPLLPFTHQRRTAVPLLRCRIRVPDSLSQHAAPGLHPLRGRVRSQWIHLFDLLAC
jgi:hypothetical protein